MTRSVSIVLVAEEVAGIQALRLIAAKDGADLVAVLTSASSGEPDAASPPPMQPPSSAVEFFQRTGWLIQPSRAGSRKMRSTC